VFFSTGLDIKSSHTGKMNYAVQNRPTEKKPFHFYM